MNTHFIKYSIGKLLQLLSFFMFIPAVVAFFEVERPTIATLALDHAFCGFAAAIVLSFILGTLLTLRSNKNIDERTIREGFAIVTFGWLLITFFGCIPLFMHFIGVSGRYDLPSLGCFFTDAFFEAMSGFTTTGSSILPNVEILPASILLWRSMTHWLGGMGIVTFGLAVFPAFGAAANQLFRGEATGPTTERISPSFSNTAKILWSMYALLTLIEALLLYLGGMSVLDAVCHAFGSMSTGGFSTKNASIAAYHSAYIEWVIVVFMFLGGMNFMIHYNIIFFRKFDALTKNHEFRFYMMVIVGAIIISVLSLQLHGVGDKESVMRSYRSTPLTAETADAKIAMESEKIKSIGSTIRYATFQVVSVVTSTGFCTADFDMWPNTVKVILIIIMFFGGCAGSTSGGMKMVRIMIIIKASLREIRSMIQPRQIISVRIANKAIDEKQVHTVLGFFTTFLLCTALCTFIMSFMIPDFTTAFTAVVASICDCGPGLAGVGPMETYAWLPPAGKWVLSFCMLLGRLELYTVLIAFAPATWRK